MTSNANSQLREALAALENGVMSDETRFRMADSLLSLVSVDQCAVAEQLAIRSVRRGLNDRLNGASQPERATLSGILRALVDRAEFQAVSYLNRPQLSVLHREEIQHGRK